MKSDLKEVKQVKPSDDDDPLPNETPILLLLPFSLVSVATFLTSVVVKSKCLREGEGEGEREGVRERERKGGRERERGERRGSERERERERKRGRERERGETREGEGEREREREIRIKGWEADSNFHVSRLPLF